ncbi:GNAT family N-acetyltransferase [Aquibacillus kalidii]|uniref:GNAT family N-acetyltransferase n=1 Tax=Aquibacillus kalidii TaxID=2762597 RepID=UPI00164732D5|nr:GNAT family N-acetyltransferase [Aquibacillus kalidii]
MIRQLTEADDGICQRLIHKKPAENLFIIGDIEAYGYRSDFQKVWGDFDQHGELRAILLKYEKNYIPFAIGSFDVKGFAAIINQADHTPMLSGLKEITKQFEPHLNFYLKSKRELFYAKCTNETRLPDINTSSVKKAKTVDIPRLEKLLKSVPEFKEISFTKESKKRNMESGSSRVFYIEDGNEMVSTASTSAENSISAMVVGVATSQEYKKKGYATKCMTKLCKELLHEGKELCLFYDNPDAGKIYKRIGFEDIGFWMMYTFE